MIAVLFLLAFGMFLSAFFSGSETGFYRVARVRLAIDARGGDIIARSLIWLTNNPALFVATTLTGNNLANYLTSLAIVLATQTVVSKDMHMAELVVPIAVAPILFVYGELLPKSLFYAAPNKLLRQGGPLFLFFTLLFAPVSAILWLVGRFLQWMVGEAPERLHSTLARKELKQVLEEGHELGILRPAQRQLALGTFAFASLPVTNFCTPVARWVSVRLGSSLPEVLRLARRHHATHILVTERLGRRLVGYARVVDMYELGTGTLDKYEELLEIKAHDLHISALLQMQQHKTPLAKVVDDAGRTVGLLDSKRLTSPLLKGD